jgi:hypothetical protein
MTMNRTAALFAGIGLLTALVAGCASTGPRPVAGGLAGELDDAPEWVLAGCDAYYGESTKVLCGVGSVGSTRNIGAARKGAIQRARLDIAEQLGVRVKGLVKDYQATVTGGDGFGTAADDEQKIEAASKAITEHTLSGSRVVQTWLSDKSTLWVLVALDPDAFKASLNSLKGLDPKLREQVDKNAEKIFEELDKSSM